MNLPNGRKSDVVRAYRDAAQHAFGVSVEEAERYIVHPAEDRGGWAPKALAIVYLEASGRDSGHLPHVLSPEHPTGLDNCAQLDRRAAQGAFVEWINGAVAAVWPA